jgi:hypothetical protein
VTAPNDVSGRDSTATPEPARFGEVIHTRPSPEEFEDAAERVRTLRLNLGVLRSEVENLGDAWSPLPADDKRFRDVEGLLTAALVLLYDAECNFPKWADTKREKLAHPETYVIREGWADERREHALVSLWWWDRYHQRFGPDLKAMPWRSSNGSPRDAS